LLFADAVGATAAEAAAAVVLFVAVVVVAAGRVLPPPRFVCAALVAVGGGSTLAEATGESAVTAEAEGAASTPEATLAGGASTGVAPALFAAATADAAAGSE
jgi:hypothetical protein